VLPSKGFTNILNYLQFNNFKNKNVGLSPPSGVQLPPLNGS